MHTPPRSAIREAQEAARTRGDRTFVVSDPCANGHTAERRTSNGICITCATEYRTKAKPKDQRLLRLPATDMRLVQLHQDNTTASLAATSRKRFQELTGRPISKSVVYRAAIRALALYLSNATNPAEVKSLIF